MSMLSPLTGELSDSKVAAVFGRESTARTVAAQVRERLGLKPSQVQVLTPLDSHPGRKLEPEGQGIVRTLVIAHYKLAVFGLIAGAVLFAVLYAMGLDAVTSSPRLAAVVIMGYGGVFGLMAGGLVALRPDHTPYVNRVKDALEDGSCAVVVHAFDIGQRDRAAEVLSSNGGKAIRTL